MTRPEPHAEPARAANPAPPRHDPYAGVPRKRNRRTLKRRVRRVIYLSGYINLIVFGLLMLLFAAFIFKPIADAASNYISSATAEEIASPPFLDEMNIERLEDFDPASREARLWFDTLGKMTKVDYFLPFMEWNVATGEPAPDSGDIHFAIDEHAADDAMVYMTIELNGKTVYTNGAAEADPLLVKLSKFYDSSIAKPIVNADGETVGTVTVGLSPLAGAVMLAFAVVLFVAAVVIMQLITLILSHLFAIPVLKPLQQLNANIKGIAEDHYEEVAASRVELKRPLREIEQLADATNLIMAKMRHYSAVLEAQNKTLEEHKDELEAQNNELFDSRAAVEAAQREIARKEAALRNLLNNAGQGFLSFGPDLLIHPVYSQQAAHLLAPGADLAGSSFPAIAAQGDEEHRTFLENVLLKLMQERDPGRREIYLPLLTDTLEAGGRHIHIDYKIIPDPEEPAHEIVMAVLTDITEKRAMQSQIETERNTLKMVVRVMANYADFAASAKDFRQFLAADLDQIMAKADPMKEKLAVLFRQLHTYKGTFAQWGLQHAPARLHEAETLLAKLGKETVPPESSAVLAAVRSIGLAEALDADLEALQETVGRGFFEDRDVLLVDRARLLEIEKKMIGTLSPPDCRALLPELRKLRYKPFKELLRSYPEYTLGVAERMEKYIHPFEVTGDDLLADTDKFGDFGRSLVHLFRNAVDHGIETAEERAAAGKEEYANMLCRVKREGDAIALTIADDGRGIDTDALRERAAAAGIASAAELAALGDAEVNQLVFRGELSTRAQVTELSGRGIGLSAVKDEVERLGGEIVVLSERGRGTIFHIVLPMEDLNGLPDPVLPEAVEPLVGTAESFFAEQAGIRFDTPHAPLSKNGSDKLALHKVTTFINVRGALEGVFVLSVDDRLSRSLLQCMVIGGLPPEEEDAFVEEGLAEAANIVLGNSLHKMGGLEEFILMDPPITFHTEGASVKYADADIWTCRLTAECGLLTVGFVQVKKSTL